MKSKSIYFGLLASLFIFSGCQTLHQGAHDVGKPIGGIARTPQAVMEGAADGYAGDSNTNPYGR